MKTLYQESKNMFDDSEIILIDSETSTQIGTVKKVSNNKFLAYAKGKQQVTFAHESIAKAYVASSFYKWKPQSTIKNQGNQLNLF